MTAGSGEGESLIFKHLTKDKSPLISLYKNMSEGRGDKRANQATLAVERDHPGLITSGGG